MNKEVLEAAASLKMCRERIATLLTLAASNGQSESADKAISTWADEANTQGQIIISAVMESLYPDKPGTQVGLDVRQMSDYQLMTIYNVVGALVALLGKIAEFQQSSIGTINPYTLFNMLKEEKDRRNADTPHPGWYIEHLMTTVTDIGMGGEE